VATLYFFPSFPPHPMAQYGPPESSASLSETMGSLQILVTHSPGQTLCGVSGGGRRPASRRPRPVPLAGSRGRRGPPLRERVLCGRAVCCHLFAMLNYCCLLC